MSSNVVAQIRNLTAEQQAWLLMEMACLVREEQWETAVARTIEARPAEQVAS